MREVVFAHEIAIPVLLGVLGQVQESRLLEVVTHEVRLIVEDELPAQRARPRLRHPGLGRFGAADIEERSEDLVHRQERRGHAGAACQELPPAQAVPGAELGRQILDPRLHMRLLASLGKRVEFAVRHDLGGNG